MRASLWMSLFLTGVLLAACTRQNSPFAPAARPVGSPCAAETRETGEPPLPAGWDDEKHGSAGGYYYLARQKAGGFVLHFVDRATREDNAVCSASGTRLQEGCSFRWQGCVIKVCAAQDRLFVACGGDAAGQAGTAPPEIRVC